LTESQQPYRTHDNETTSRTFPNLRLVERLGFDHEISDVESGDLVARVNAWGEAAQDTGLQLARLFATAPKLYEACQAAEFCLSLIAKESDLTAEGHALKLIHAACAQAEGRTRE
jgi:hypothetical protein